MIGVTDSGSGMESVQFVVWNGENGQDDVKIYTGKDEGSGTYSVEINTADHDNQVEELSLLCAGGADGQSRKPTDD